jgi:dTDP-4-dehydrorhamnose 3,5-epimerase
MVRSIIDGVQITPLKIIADERGAVLHMLRIDSEGYFGFGECYFSEVNPGVVKAWKKHTLQTQNIAVPSGRLRLVLFDDREVVSSNGKIDILELGRPNNYFRVTIPPLIWYGFTSISDTPALIVNCVNIPHTPDETVLVPVSDNLIPYKW